MLDHVLHVLEVQKIAVQVFYTFDLLPRLRLFVTKTEQVVGRTHKA